MLLLVWLREYTVFKLSSWLLKSQHRLLSTEPLFEREINTLMKRKNYSGVALSLFSFCLCDATRVEWMEWRGCNLNVTVTIISIIVYTLACRLQGKKKTLLQEWKQTFGQRTMAILLVEQVNVINAILTFDSDFSSFSWGSSNYSTIKNVTLTLLLCCVVVQIVVLQLIIAHLVPNNVSSF